MHPIDIHRYQHWCQSATIELKGCGTDGDEIQNVKRMFLFRTIDGTKADTSNEVKLPFYSCLLGFWIKNFDRVSVTTRSVEQRGPKNQCPNVMQHVVQLTSASAADIFIRYQSMLFQLLIDQATAKPWLCSACETLSACRAACSTEIRLSVTLYTLHAYWIQNCISAGIKPARTTIVN